MFLIMFTQTSNFDKPDTSMKVSKGSMTNGEANAPVHRHLAIIKPHSTQPSADLLRSLHFIGSYHEGTEIRYEKRTGIAEIPCSVSLVPTMMLLTVVKINKPVERKVIPLFHSVI